MQTLIAQPSWDLATLNTFVAQQEDTSKNRWQLGLIADSVLSGDRGMGDGGSAGIFRW